MSLLSSRRTEDHVYDLYAHEDLWTSGTEVSVCVQFLWNDDALYSDERELCAIAIEDSGFKDRRRRLGKDQPQPGTEQLRMVRLAVLKRTASPQRSRTGRFGERNLLDVLERIRWRKR